MKSVTCIALFGLFVLLQADATTYRLALKNGTIVQFQQYRVAGQVVYYTDKDDREIGVPLADVDMDRTRRLNAAASPPLQIPDIAGTDAGTNAQGEISLGDVARRLRGKKSPPGGKGTTYTNDDFTGSASKKRPPPQNQLDPNAAWDASRIRALMVEWERLTPEQQAQVALDRLRDVYFPSRPEWTRRLSAQVREVQAAVEGSLQKDQEYTRLRDALRLTKMLLASDVESLEKARLAAEEAREKFRRQVYKYQELQNEGRRLATDWKAK
jgi:hypothetical protein